MNPATPTIKSGWKTSATEPSYPPPSPPERSAPPAPRFGETIDRFINQLWSEAGLAENTLTAYRTDLSSFSAFCDKNNIELRRIEPVNLQKYLLSLRETSQLAVSSIARRLVAIKLFLRYCYNNGWMEHDVATQIESPKKWQHLPTVLNTNQADALMSLPDEHDPLAVRDRAILELFYATGLRVSELTGLRMEDVNLDVGYLRCVGKGRRERIVPVGSRAIESLREYLTDLRPHLAEGRSTNRLFLSRTGRGLDRTNAWRLVVKYARRLGISGKLSPHTLRHTFATHLLAGGADVRVVQELLGHADVATTQIYTHVDSSRLKAVHSKFHPRQ